MKKCSCDLKQVPPRHTYDCVDRYCLCDANKEKHYHAYGFVFASDKYSKKPAENITKDVPV